MGKEIRITLHIDATPVAVWDTLTNPVKIAQYMYGAIAHSDWQPGSTIHYYFSQDGREILVVKGEVILSKEHRYLEHTLFPTTWNLPDIPENYLSAVYKLTPAGDGTDLTVMQSDFSRVAEGERRYHGAIKVWGEILPKIAATAEAES